jgi:hypothetical protein
MKLSNRRLVCALELRNTALRLLKALAPSLPSPLISIAFVRCTSRI